MKAAAETHRPTVRRLITLYSLVAVLGLVCVLLIPVWEGLTRGWSMRLSHRDYSLLPRAERFLIVSALAQLLVAAVIHLGKMSTPTPLVAIFVLSWMVQGLALGTSPFGSWPASGLVFRDWVAVVFVLMWALALPIIGAVWIRSAREP
jgi:hypothetical protein